MTRPSRSAWVVSVILIVFVTMGTRLSWAVVPYVVVITGCLICALVAIGKITPRDHFLYLFTMSLSLLWQTSLLGEQIVGSDVHTEMYITRVSILNGWDWSLPHQYNASIMVTVIIPFLSKMLNVDPVWIYKVLPPIFLALVAPVMYLVFRKQFGKTRAFWASVFFITVPVMMLELVGNAKSGLAELTLALALLVMVSNIKQLQKGLLISVLMMLSLACHYTVGLIATGLMVVGFGIVTVSKIARTKMWTSKIKVTTAIAVIIVTLGAGYAYFGTISDGNMVKFLTQVADRTATKNMVELGSGIKSAIVAPTDPATKSKAVVPSQDTDDTPQPKSLESYFAGQSDLLRSAIGLDFKGASGWGKVFRVIQYLTQLLIVLGLVQLWRKRREYKVTAEFVACMLAGFGLLTMCVLFAQFGTITDTTRTYQITLFFLAPLFVLGCELLFRWWWRAVLPTLLLMYFVFTSGTVFEMTHNETLDRVDIPYSLAMSYERIGITGVFSENDAKCVEWLVHKSDKDLPIATDVNTDRLLEGEMEWRPRLYPFDWQLSNADWNLKGAVSWSLWRLPNDEYFVGYYVFLSEWNMRHGKAVLLGSVGSSGTRELREIPEYVHKLPVVFRAGSAVVYEVRFK